MFKTIAAGAALAAVLMTAGAALTQQRQDFTLTNQTGYVIVTLNVSPQNQMRWGPDILGSGYLANGESAQVAFSGDADVCVWDLRVTYQDGDTGEWRGVNLCETGQVTLGAS